MIQLYVIKEDQRRSHTSTSVTTVPSDRIA